MSAIPREGFSIVFDIIESVWTPPSQSRLKLFLKIAILDVLHTCPTSEDYVDFVMSEFSFLEIKYLEKPKPYASNRGKKNFDIIVID